MFPIVTKGLNTLSVTLLFSHDLAAIEYEDLRTVDSDWAPGEMEARGGKRSGECGGESYTLHFTPLIYGVRRNDTRIYRWTRSKRVEVTVWTLQTASLTKLDGLSPTMRLISRPIRQLRSGD
jgi:hypothetical protein